MVEIDEVLEVFDIQLLKKDDEIEIIFEEEDIACTQKSKYPLILLFCKLFCIRYV